MACPDWIQHSFFKTWEVEPKSVLISRSLQTESTQINFSLQLSTCSQMSGTSYYFLCAKRSCSYIFCKDLSRGKIRSLEQTVSIHNIISLSQPITIKTALPFVTQINKYVRVWVQIRDPTNGMTETPGHDYWPSDWPLAARIGLALGGTQPLWLPENCNLRGGKTWHVSWGTTGSSWNLDVGT